MSGRRSLTTHEPLRLPSPAGAAGIPFRSTRAGEGASDRARRRRPPPSPGHLSRVCGHPSGRYPVIIRMGAIPQQSSLNFLFDSRRNFAGFGRLFCRFSKSRDHSHCPKPYRED